MAGSYSLSKFQKMARPKTAGERNEQLMMDKVGDTDTDTDNDGNNNNNIMSGSEAAGAHLGPRGEAPVSLPQPRRQWYPGPRQVGPVLGRIWCMPDFMFSLPPYFRQYQVRCEQAWPAVESINILNIS